MGYSMDDDNIYDVTVGGFNLMGLLLAFTLIAIFMFAVYWMWDCSCRQADELEERPIIRSTPTPVITRQTVSPLYAFELEPGTVVLQSADGEIFRILREYDSVGRTGRGSPPKYESVATSSTSNEFHYVPSYTRAHFQTRPTAPEWTTETSGSSSSCRTQALNEYHPTDDAFGEFSDWVPINTQRR